MGTFTEETEYHVITPGCCGVAFAMSDPMYNHRVNSRQTFWCPNCGTARVFTAKTDFEKKAESLERQLESQKNSTRYYREIAETRGRQNRKMRQNMDHEKSEDQMVLRKIRLRYGMSQKDLSEETGVNQAYISKFENGHESLPDWAVDNLINWMEAQT
jgi:ribosome-binding protein aMBF1 (putative translation factor)